MKKEKSGCLFGLVAWLGKVLFSFALAFLCIGMIWTWSYQNVKPFKAFVDGYPMFQVHKGKGVPEIKVQLPDDSVDKNTK